MRRTWRWTQRPKPRGSLRAIGYIYDPNEAAAKRSSWDAGLDKAILIKLHKMLLHLDSTGVQNPYAIAYKHMHEKMQEQVADGIEPLVALRFRSGSTPDPRRYNEPACRDIAVVYTDSHPTPRL